MRTQPDWQIYTLNLSKERDGTAVWQASELLLYQVTFNDVMLNAAPESSAGCCS